MFFKEYHHTPLNQERENTTKVGVRHTDFVGIRKPIENSLIEIDGMYIR